MTRRCRSAAGLVELPQHVRRVIRAAERECPNGHGRALRDLTTLAMRKAPARGIFDPAAHADDELFAAIDRVATRHLGRAATRRVWAAALRRARLDLETRDRIERAALQAQGVSDTAYFYAGLAFGLTWISLSRGD